MNKDNLTIWNKMKEKIRSENPELTENDLTLERGGEKKLVGRIESRLGTKRRARIVEQMKTDGMVLTEI